MKDGARGHGGTGAQTRRRADAQTARSGRADGRTGGRNAGRPHARRTPHHARITLTVNGEPRDVLFDGYKTLLEVLREDLALTGTKHGCELGECGACAVLMNGHPVLSCLALGVDCDGAVVTTIEGLADGPALHPLQAAFADLGAAQCGYCTPGILLTAKHLLDHNPSPTRREIAETLSGNLCRCTGYIQIFEAVEAAAAETHGRVGKWESGSGRTRRAGSPTRGRAADSDAPRAPLPAPAR